MVRTSTQDSSRCAAKAWRQFRARNEAYSETRIQFNPFHYLLEPLRLLPAGVTVAGRVSDPERKQRLSTAHDKRGRARRRRSTLRSPHHPCPITNYRSWKAAGRYGPQGKQKTYVR